MTTQTTIFTYFPRGKVKCAIILYRAKKKQRDKIICGEGGGLSDMISNLQNKARSDGYVYLPLLLLMHFVIFAADCFRQEKGGLC